MPRPGSQETAGHEDPCGVRKLTAAKPAPSRPRKRKSSERCLCLLSGPAPRANRAGSGAKLNPWEERRYGKVACPDRACPGRPRLLAVFLMMCLTTADALWRYASTARSPALRDHGKIPDADRGLSGHGPHLSGRRMIRVTILMDACPPGLRCPSTTSPSSFPCLLHHPCRGDRSIHDPPLRTEDDLGSIFDLPLWFGALFIPLGSVLLIFILLDFPGCQGGLGLFRSRGPPPCEGRGVRRGRNEVTPWN
jgi:hypothetical protein